MRIDIRGLVQSFSNRPVLEIDAFSSDFPSTLALIGPSGGGKSTLLRVLAGLLIPDRGEIDVDGIRLSRESKKLRDYRKSIGVVFQGFNLFPHLSARENVMLPLKQVHGLSDAEAGQRTDEILERFGLLDHGNKQPGALSGGQRQRIAIARALAIRPKLLFLDEPTSALDPEMTAEVLEVLEEIKKQGGKFVIVTHAMGFAGHVADEVAFLSHGKILESGNAKDFFSSPRSVEVKRFLERVLRY